jgi:hypothetical protein
MNRSLPRGGFRYRSSDTSRPSRSGGAVLGSGRLVGGVTGDRRQAGTDALNVIRNYGKPSLDTLCATNTRMEVEVGQCC